MKKSIFLSLVLILIFGGLGNSLRTLATDLEGEIQDNLECLHEHIRFENLGLTHKGECEYCHENMGEEAHVDENDDMCCDACSGIISNLAPSEGEGYVSSEMTLNESIKISISANKNEVSEIIVSSWFEINKDDIYETEAEYNETTGLYEVEIEFSAVNGSDGTYYFDATIYDEASNMRYVRISEVKYTKNGISNVTTNRTPEGDITVEIEAVEGGEIYIATNGEEPTLFSNWQKYNAGETYTVEDEGNEINQVKVYYKSKTVITDPTVKIVGKVSWIEELYTYENEYGVFDYFKDSTSKYAKIIFCTPTGTTVEFPSHIEGLRVIELENYNSGSAYNIFGGSFTNTNSNLNVKEIILPKTLEIIGDYAFVGASYLICNLNIPGSVINIGDYAFYGCKWLTGSLEIPNSVINIGDYAFSNCSKLTGNLEIPDSVINIGNYAFSGCGSLTGTLKLGKSVTNIGEWVFPFCQGISYIEVDEENDNYKDIEGILFSKDGSVLIQAPTGMKKENYIIPDGVISIGAMAFYQCSGFVGSLTISDSVTNIGMNAFSECSGFTGNLIIPNSVINIDSGAFSDCIGFNGNLIIGNSVKSIGSSSFYECSGFSGNLVIPNSVETIGSHAFYYCSGFNGKLVIGSGVSKISDSAFEGCNGLIGDLIIPDNVIKISSYAFFNCSGFNGNLKISNNLTTIEGAVFYGCSGLSGNLIIPNSVTKIGSHAFNGCQGFTGKLMLPSSITSIGSDAFNTCSGFNGGLLIPNKVTSIGAFAFSECHGLDYILLMQANIIPVVTPNDTFAGKTIYALTQEIADVYNTQSNWREINGGNNIQKIFYVKNIKEQIKINSTFIDYGANIGGLLEDNSELLKIKKSYSIKDGTIVENIDTSKIEVYEATYTLQIKSGDGYIDVTNSVGEIEQETRIIEIVEETNYEPIENITWNNEEFTSGIFSYYKDSMSQYVRIIKCVPDRNVVEFPEYIDGLRVIYIGNIRTNYNVFDSYFNDSYTEVIGVLLPNTLQIIGEYAFSGCKGLRHNLVIPNNVTTIENNAFNGCSGLTGNINIPSSVISIGHSAFEACKGITYIEVEEQNTKYKDIDGILFSKDGTILIQAPGGMQKENYSIPNGVLSITNKAFYECKGFTGELIIPNSVTTIGMYSFYGCSGFNESLTIGNNVSEIGGYAFGECSGFTGNLELPDSVISLGNWTFYNCSGFNGNLKLSNNLKDMGNYTFLGCSGLIGDLIIPDAITIIGVNVFKDCVGFTGNLTIPNRVTSIGSQAFYNCRGFTGNLTIPDSVTSIGGETFYGCSGFSGSLVISDSITSISYGAFRYCSGFSESLTIPNSVTSIGSYAFYGCSGFIGDLIIPNSVTTIGEYAFCRCSGFNGKLIISENVISIGRNAFYECYNLSGNVIIPESVESIGSFVFSDNKDLKYILLINKYTIPSSDTKLGINGVYALTFESASLYNSVSSWNQNNDENGVFPVLQVLNITAEKVKLNSDFVDNGVTVAGFIEDPTGLLKVKKSYRRIDDIAVASLDGARLVSGTETLDTIDTSIPGTYEATYTLQIKSGDTYLDVTNSKGELEQVSREIIVMGEEPYVTDIVVTNLANGEYQSGNEIIFNVIWDTEVEILEAPDLIIKFAGDNTEATATYVSTESNISTYQYTIDRRNFGLLMLDEYKGGYVNDVYDQIWISSEITFEEEITAKLNPYVKLIETKNGEITENYYPAIRIAIDYASESTEIDDETYSVIEMLEDDPLDKTIIIPDNKKVEIDLKGKEISIESATAIRNNSELKIIDSLGEGKIISNKTAIENNNKLILGENDSIINIESPYVYGEESGIITEAESTIYFYDGKIESNGGNGSAIQDSIGVIKADGYGIAKELNETKETAILKLLPQIVKQPQNVTTEANKEVTLAVEATGDNLSYNWKKVYKENGKVEDCKDIYKSNIEGESNGVSTETIEISGNAPGKLSFEYIVKSEEENDILTIKITDANGEKIVANEISGNLEWQTYSAEHIPLDEKITITITYAKNESIDKYGDYGAIKNLNFTCKGSSLNDASYTTSEYATVTTPSYMFDDVEYAWEETILDGEIVYKTASYDTEGMASSMMMFNTTKPLTISFDYKVESEDGNDMLIAYLMGAGEPMPVQVMGSSEWRTATLTAQPTEDGMIMLLMGFMQEGTSSENGDYAVIRNLKYGYENNISVISPLYMESENEQAFVKEIIGGEIAFKTNTSNIEEAYSSIGFLYYTKESVDVSLDYKLTSSDNDMLAIMSVYGDGENGEVCMLQGESEWMTYEDTLEVDPSAGMVGFYVIHLQNGTESPTEDYAIVKNIKIDGKEILQDVNVDVTSNFEDDEIFKFTNNNWSTVSYEGTNTNTLTIPAFFVTEDIEKYAFFAEVSNDAGSVESEKATIIVEEPRDDIYDIINKDTANPIIDNINITPASGTIGPNSEVVLTFNVTDANYDYLGGSLLYPDDIEVLVNGLDAITAIKDLTKATIPSGERFTLTVNNIWGDGNLSFKIPAGAIQDLALNGNDEYIINTGLTVSRSLVAEVTNFRATSGDSENSITVSWQDPNNTGTIKYVLEASTGDNTWVVLKDGAASPYTHGSLSKNMSFEYRIKAVDAEGNESGYVYTIGRTMYDPLFGDVMIDTINPIIELKGKNPEVDYIGSTQELKLTFESFDENYNYDLSNVNENSFIINVAGKENEDVIKTLTKTNIASGERFVLTLSNITGTGKLTVKVLGGVIRDSALNPNLETEIDTEITVMNGETITKDAPTLVPDVHEITVTTNQISTIPVTNIIYEYRVSGDSEFIKFAETKDITVTITGLSSNTDYEVRTTVTDVAGNSVTSESAFTTTLKIDASAISIDHETKNWTNLVAPNPEVIATITWNDSTYTHEYSLDGNSWTPVTGATTNIDILKNTTVYARYSDGVGHSDPVTYEIGNIDLIKPEIGSVVITPEGKANTKKVTVTGITDEGGSRVKGYYYNTDGSLTNASWQPLSVENFEFIADQNTIYYIWVIDNAGNVSEAGMANVTDIVGKVTNIVIDSEIEVEVFDKETPNLTYDGEPKTKVWEITDSNIATIDPVTGEITGVASGETTAKVTITDYDGTVTVKEIKVIVTAVTPTLEINSPKEFTFTYGDAKKETTYSYNGSGEISVSSDENIAKAEVSGNKIIITPVNAGTTKIIVTAAKTPQYESVTAEIPVTVNKLPVILEWNENEFIYDNTEKEVTATIKNLVGTDDVKLGYTGNTATVVGNYEASVTSLTGTKANNYTLENGTNITHNWVIKKSDRVVSEIPNSLNITFGEPEKITVTYEGEDTTVTSNHGDESVVTTTVVDGNLSAEVIFDGVSTGVYEVTITIPATDNYNEYTKKITVTVSPATGGITVTSGDVTLTYGDDEISVPYEYEGNGKVTASSSNETIVETIEDEANKVIKIKPIKASDEIVTITIKTAATDQFEASETSIKVKVNPRIIEVTWGEDSFPFDGTPQRITATIDNLVEEDKVIISYSGNTGINAGNYKATITGLDDSNYTIEGAENLSHNWEITRLNITPSLTMNDYVYGGEKANPVISGNTENGTENFFVYKANEDETSAINWKTVTSSTYLEPGTYKMYATVDETTNYNAAKTNTVEFTITKEDVTVTITENGEIYDNDWTNNNVIATITVPESVGTMSTVYYRVSGDNTYYAYVNTTENGNVVTITFDSNINKEIYFVAVDAAGKALTNEKGPYSVKVDKTKPEIGSVVVEPAINETSNTKTIKVSGITDKGGSGIYGYYVGNDLANATWTTLDADNFTYEVTENGTYNIYVKDVAGNVSDIADGFTSIEITTIVDEVTNAKMDENLEVEVFKTIETNLSFSGEASKVTYTIEDPNVATIDQTTGIITATNVGETKVIITIENYDEDIEDIVLETTLKVTPRVVTLSWDEDTFIYDGTTKTVTATVTNARPEDNVTVTSYKNNSNQATDVGNYTAIAESLSDSNYTLVGADTSHNFEIIADTLEPTVIMSDYVYGGDISTPQIAGNKGNGAETIYVYSEDIANKINWNDVTSSVYLAPGTYHMYAEIGATANYEAATTDVVSFEVIIKDIEVNLTENGSAYDNEWTNQDVVATVTVPVEVTTMGSVYYRINGEDTLITSADTTQNGNIFTLTFNESINEEISFVAVNKEGRPVTNESALNVIKVDKEAPIIGSVVVNPEVTITSNTKNIEVSNITDAGESGIYGYYVGEETDPTKVTWTTLTENNFTFMVDRNDTFNIFVRDVAGNVSVMTEVIIENIVPGVTNIVIDSEVEVEVFDTVTPNLTYSGEAADITWEIEDEGVATIDPETGEITGVSSGETTAKVTIENFDGSKIEKEVKVIVKATTPTLKVNEPNDFTLEYGGEAGTTTIEYSGTGSTITVSTSDDKVAEAEITGNTITVTPTGVGEATITVTASATKEYVEVSETIKVTVTPRPVVLEWTADTFTYDGIEKIITAVVKNKVGTDTVNVTAYEDNSNRATDAGNYTAVATEINNKNYTLTGGTNIEKSWVINKALRNLKVNPESIELTFGTNGNISFSYDKDLTDEPTVEVLTNNPNVVTIVEPIDKVNNNITIAPVGAGEAIVTVKVGPTKNYSSGEETVNVKVRGAKAELEVTEPNITFTYGDAAKETTYEYTGNAAVSDMTIVSEESNVAEAVIVGNKIVITPKNAGTTKITITAPETSQYDTASSEIIVTVNPLKVNITWGEDSFTYDTNEKEITATIDNIVGSDDVSLTYENNKKTDAGNYIAKVTGLSGTSANNYTIENLENAEKDWVINKAERNVTVDDFIEIKYGKNGELTYSYNGEDVTAIATIANELVAKIKEIEDGENSGKIIITPQGSGETEIELTIPSSKNYEEKKVPIKVKSLGSPASLEINESEISFVYGDTVKNVTFQVTEGVGVSIESSNPGVATGTIIDNKVMITPYGVGTATLTLTTEETNQFMPVSKTIKVTVSPRPVVLDWGNTKFNYDGNEKTITAVVKNAIIGDSILVEQYEGNKATDIGTYIAKATKISNPNYTLVGGSNVTVEWTIDYLTPPDIIVKQGGVRVPSDTWASGDVTIEIPTINGAGSDIAYEYSYNNTTWFEYTGIFNFTEETTETMIYARAYSKVTGIAASTIGEYKLKLDKTDPVISLESVTATGSVNGIINKDSEVTIVLSIKDFISGIEDGEFSLEDIKVIATNKGETIELTDITKLLEADASNSMQENGTYTYTITLKNIDADGRLSLKFMDKAVNDRATRYSKQKTISLNLVVDNKGPEVGKIETSADEYGRVFGNTVDLEVTAKDESGIKSYEWQVSKDGKTWETFIKEETSTEFSDVIYDALEDGVHHFRVIVTDIIGNQSISDIVSINMNLTMNRKPTIRFETEQEAATRVKITAIVKSTKPIESIKVNSSELDKSTWHQVKTNNELTIEVEFVATSNGTYVWTVVDSVGNIATETINITTIDDNAAIITYEAYDVTEYSPAKIEFKANEDIRISKIISAEGTTTNIVNGKEFTGMTFTSVDFARKTSVEIKNIDFKVGTTFVFENRAFIETHVIIEKEIQTKLIYVRAVSAGTKLFSELFGDTFDEERAELLVNQMMVKTKSVLGKVTPYYGITSSKVNLRLSNESELKAISYLSAATNGGEIRKLTKYGDTKEIEAKVAGTSGGNTTYINGNVTGIKVFGNIINWTGNAIKNTFRITIKPR